MKVVSLFSGAGALDWGLHQAGHEVILLCESDPGARQVLKKAFPGVEVSDDVTSLSRLPKETELLTAGFPCIDVSRAGLRRGLDGQSTGLVRHVFRLLKRARDDRHPVPWVLLENVDALLDRHGGDPPVMQYVVQQLIGLGYGSVAWRVVNSAGFGIPNRRRRVFIVASLHGDARDVLLTQGTTVCPGSCVKLFGGRKCYHCHVNTPRDRADLEQVSYALDMGNAMSQAGEDIVPTFTTSNDRMLLLLSSGKSGYLRVEDAERLQGLPEGHTAPCWPVQQPGIGAHRNTRVKDSDAEAAASKRWDLLGNAVTVPVAGWLGERLARPYAYKYHTASSSDRRMDHLVSQGSSDPNLMDRGPTNIWSYVTLGGLQDAVLFPYLVKKKKARDSAAPEQEEQEGEEGVEGADGSGGSSETAAAAAAADGSPSQEQHAQQVEEEAAMEQEQEEEAAPEAASEPEADAAAGEGPADGSSSEGEGGSGEGGSSVEDAATVAAREAAAKVDQAGVADEDEQRAMFQSEIIEKVWKGRLQGSKPTSPTYDRESWPRAGWWVRDMGSFACEGMSEVPVPTPFEPLGVFIEEVGRPPREEEVNAYINRLQERGWDTSNTLAKLLRNNTRVSKEVQEVIRIEGLLQDSDLIGDIVWALDPVSQTWWPSEVLDPLNLPFGRSLPPGAIAHLTHDQKVASLAGYPPQNAAAQTSAEQRRVLVLYLPVGGSSYNWYRKEELLPYEAHAAEKERAASAAIRDSKYRHAEPLKQALADARASLAVRNGRSTMEAERMRRTRAASAAAAVNLKQRCGTCRTCMTKFGGQRQYDCLTQRMRAAALSGHAGAQLAAVGELAVGAAVQVWWEGDQTFYQGIVVHYDAVSTEHTVCYDDGEVGMHKLWQHDERIRLVTPLELWGRDAAVAKQRLRSAHEKLMGERQGQRQAQQLAAAAAAEAPPLTDYEQQRAATIAKNQEVFRQLVVAPPPPDLPSGSGAGAGSPPEGAGPSTPESDGEGEDVRVRPAAAGELPSPPAVPRNLMSEDSQGEFGVGPGGMPSGKRKKYVDPHGQGPAPKKKAGRPRTVPAGPGDKQ